MSDRAYIRTLVAILLLVAIAFSWRWISLERQKSNKSWPKAYLRDLATGFSTNFLDTLGISSFATTTTVFKLLRNVPDEHIPGTMNVGHTLPTVAQGVIFIAAVPVDSVTLIGMMVSAIAGARIGAATVTRLPPQAIRIGMAVALFTAAWVMSASNFGLLPAGGESTGLSGPALICAVGVNFILGALMTFGVGLYAPCMTLASLLGMNPLSAFPIMMGSCALLMPVAGLRFVQCNCYSLGAAFGLAVGGIPGVLVAAYLIRSAPIVLLRWLVVAVVIYTAILMLISAWRSIGPRITNLPLD